MLFAALLVIAFGAALFYAAEAVSAALLAQFCATDALLFDSSGSVDGFDADPPPEETLAGHGNRLDRLAICGISAIVEALDASHPLLRRFSWAAIDLLAFVHLRLGRALDTIFSTRTERVKKDTGRRVLREMIRSHRS